MTARYLFVFVSLCMGLVAHAAPSTRSVCVYDPAGRSGEYYRIIDAFTLAAAEWGVSLTIETYTDEETAAKDYEAGKCDAVLATGVRLQRFNRFSSTIEAMGAITNYPVLGQLVAAFVRYPSSAKRLTAGNHETVGVLPAGLVYLFVRDRAIDTVQELAGKRIATLDYDKASPIMVARVGAVMVPVDLGSMGPKFNNGNVDACYTSAMAYQPFELRRGLGTSGGVIRLPLAMATLQLLAHKDKFPEDFGNKSRAWFAGQYDQAVAAIRKEEAGIPESAWIDIPKSDLPAFEDLFLQVRLELRDKHQAYDGVMLNVLRKLRCAQTPSRSECVEQKE